jgi:uncharacterized protein YdeI (YjbR/CyaY-like superfamily)
MAKIEITQTFYAPDRAAWRQWLEENHATAREVWLLAYAPEVGKPSVAYLQAVEEALCFGWIDSIAKKQDAATLAQRFSPRRPGSNWTELNKARARRLIAQGLMTPAGAAKLPDLTLTPLQIAPDILAALQADPVAWENFQQFPDLYQRIRIGNLEEVRKQPAVFQSRLANFLAKTRQNKMYGSLE